MDRQLQKTDFGDIYDNRDPRAYFGSLEPFGYVIPQHGAELVARLLQACGATPDPRILDVCCSYGIVSTLLKTGLDVADLNAHYRRATEQELSTEELVKADRRLLEDHAVDRSVHVAGLDVAGNAVRYGVATGSLDAGFVENLETDDPSPELAAAVADVDLITTTGGVGYVTEQTFSRLVTAARDDVWVASFCLRTYDYGPIIDTLAAHGLQTERLPQTYVQRRFTDSDEQEWAMARVRELGFDPAGKEADGSYHADFFLSRPIDEVRQRSLTELLPDL